MDEIVWFVGQVFWGTGAFVWLVSMLFFAAGLFGLLPPFDLYLEWGDEDDDNDDDQGNKHANQT